MAILGGRIGEMLPLGGLEKPVQGLSGICPCLVFQPGCDVVYAIDCCFIQSAQYGKLLALREQDLEVAKLWP